MSTEPSVSDFIRNLNRIKANRRFEWLTTSQQEAFTAVTKNLQIPNTVNLFGREGTGKTFLAWMLADKLDYTYLVHPSRLEQLDHSETVGVILDNCESSRLAHREILKTMRFQQIHHAIFITHKMISDYTHYVELKLTPIDQEQVQQNLASLGMVTAVSQQSSLWHMVNPHL